MEQTPKDPQRPSKTSPAGKSRAARQRKRNNPAAQNAESTSPVEANEASTAAVVDTKPVVESDTPVSNNTGAAAPTPKAVQVDPANGNTQAEPVRDKQGGGAAITISLIALVIGLGSAVFTGWHFLQGQQERQTNALLSNDIADLKSQLAQQSSRAQGSLEQLQQQQQGNAEKMGALISNVKQAELRIQAEQEKVRNAQPQDWLLAEANYLLQMAERKLILEQDPDTAMMLLKDADARLALLSSPQLKPIRQALQNDLAKVQNLPRVDRDGIGMAMEALVQEIDNLPLNRVELPEVIEQPQSSEVSTDMTQWRANLVASWRALMDDFITVRRRQEQVQPLLAPAQEWYLREHLRGKLSQAQLALYLGDEAAMDQALKTAQGWVRDYFNLETPQVESALKRMATWQNADLAKVQSIQFSAAEPLHELVAKSLLKEAP